MMPSLWNEGGARNWQRMTAACSTFGTNWTLTTSRNRYNRSTDFSWQGWMREHCQGTPRVTMASSKNQVLRGRLAGGSQEFGKPHSQSERGPLLLSQLILSLNGRHLEAKTKSVWKVQPSFFPFRSSAKKERARVGSREEIWY